MNDSQFQKYLKNARRNVKRNYGIKKVKEILMRRDGMDEDEADDIIAYARKRLERGDNPRDVIEQEFELEGMEYAQDLVQEVEDEQRRKRERYEI
jgi:hypothetical protein